MFSTRWKAASRAAAGLGVEAEVREARLERRGHRRLAPGRGLDQEEAEALGLREGGLEVALARHELATAAGPAAARATTRTRTPESPSAKLSPSPRWST